jgi:hypothetical protein
MHLTSLKNLKILHASWCKGIEDSAFTAICRNCTKLRVLDISLCTDITDDGFSEGISYLSNLSALSAARCKHVRKIRRKF